MAVDTIPNGFPIIPILTTSMGAELYGFLERVFDAQLLDRHDADGSPAYLTIRMGNSVISVMRPPCGHWRVNQPSAQYTYTSAT